MTIRQLQKFFALTDKQRVRINDMRKVLTIESDYGWVLEPDYDYDGYNYEEVERIMKLKVEEVRFEKNWLTIWAG